MIERLQSEIDRLNRDKKVLKTRCDAADRMNEALASQTQLYTDRINNHEQSYEVNQRALARKDRQLEELRDDLKREKARTEHAQEQARIAAVDEQKWREEAVRSGSVAEQKEAEYSTIAACRDRDNGQHQEGLDKLKVDFGSLIRQREEDLESYGKLELVAEQQRETINHLERLTRDIRANYDKYRLEIDTAIAGLREHVTSNDVGLTQKVEEMQTVVGQMHWVINMEELNRACLTAPTGVQSTDSRNESRPSTSDQREDTTKERAISPTKSRMKNWKR